MSDLLVALYDLPEAYPSLPNEIHVRRAIAPERHIVCGWVRETFGEAWASEVSVAFSCQPISTYIAISKGQMVGFACFDATAKGFFGPTGVSPNNRGQGIGCALLLETLKAMKEAGYAYSIIGGAGDKEAYYAKNVKIYPIPNSVPGVYKDMLRS